MKQKTESKGLTKELIMKELGITDEEDLKGLRTMPSLDDFEEWLKSIYPWFKKYYSETDEIMPGIDDCWPEEPRNSELKKGYQNSKPFAGLMFVDENKQREVSWAAYVIWACEYLDKEEIKNILSKTE